MKIGLTQASKIALGTSCALFWVKWCSMKEGTSAQFSGRGELHGGLGSQP